MGREAKETWLLWLSLSVEAGNEQRVLVEERSRYCTFVACLKPVLGEEVSLVSELQQLEEVCAKLDKHTEDPFKLPEASEQVSWDLTCFT